MRNFSLSRPQIRLFSVTKVEYSDSGDEDDDEGQEGREDPEDGDGLTLSSAGLTSGPEPPGLLLKVAVAVSRARASKAELE